MALRGIAAVLLAVLPGCTDGEFNWFRKKEKPPEDRISLPPAVEARNKDPLFAGTVGADTVIGSATATPLRGYGLVVGLGENGSSDAPTAVRDYLVDFMGKNYAPSGVTNRRRFSPGELIDSIDSAVVEVRATVPAGTPRGARLDVVCTALPGTSTRSLEGGLLLPCQLFLYDANTSGLEGGDPLAEADGPLFVNPFSGSGSGASDPRRGLVLGGCRTATDRDMRLELIEPSYPRARTMEQRINERFGQRPRTAEAMSKSYVQIRTPPQFSGDPRRFLEAVPFVYLDNRPGAVEQRAAELATRLAAADGRAAAPRISSAWEALGRQALGALRPFYTHEDATIAYYATRAGLRIGDAGAVGVMSRLAGSAPPSLRLLAIRELGDCDAPQAPARLPPLLNSPDQETRVAAYEALLKHRHQAVRSYPIAHLRDTSQLNFVLDVVQSEGRPMIYVRRSGVPRIALFGAKMPVATPLFYSDAEDTFTLSAEANDDVSVIGRVGGRLLDPVRVPPRLLEVILAMAELPPGREKRSYTGLGVPYGRVIRTLKKLCDDGTVSATFVIEAEPLTDILGPTTEPTDRPDADMPQPDTDDTPPADRPETAPAPEAGAPADDAPLLPVTPARKDGR